MKHIILAGGCFWGLEHLLGQLSGVVQTQVGYAGGDYEAPSYSDVKTGMTGHAESVKIIYDKNLISLDEILHFFFKIHDPTTKDRQGNDTGSQYRSVIIVENEEEKNLVNKVIGEVNALGRFKDVVVTQILIGKQFFLAEEYHQKYLEKNPNGYTCHWLRA